MKYDLVGVDGNAHSIMGYVRWAMKNEGYSTEDIAKYTKDAMSGDYCHLLALSVDMIEEINERLERQDWF